MSPTRKARIKRGYFKLRPFKRHSLVLLVAGTVYICLGLSYMFTPLSNTGAVGLELALKWFPISTWGGVWFAVGVLAIVSSRWPPVFESWGYMVLTALAAGWSATYLVGILFLHAPMANIRSVAVWGLLAFLWWAVSGLLNPDRGAVQAHANGDSHRNL